MRQFISFLLSLLALTASANIVDINVGSLTTYETFTNAGYIRFDISPDPLTKTLYVTGVGCDPTDGYYTGKATPGVGGVHHDAYVIIDQEWSYIQVADLCGGWLTWEDFYESTSHNRSGYEKRIYRGTARVYINNELYAEGTAISNDYLRIEPIIDNNSINGTMLGVRVYFENYYERGTKREVCSWASDCINPNMITVVYHYNEKHCNLEVGDHAYKAMNYAPVNHNTAGKTIVSVAYLSYPWLLPVTNPQEGKKYYKVEKYSDGQIVKRLITYQKGVRQ